MTRPSRLFEPTQGRFDPAWLMERCLAAVICAGIVLAVVALGLAIAAVWP